MANKELNALVKRFGGWWDDEHIRFPTPHQKDEFLKALKEAEAKDKT